MYELCRAFVLPMRALLPLPAAPLGGGAPCHQGRAQDFGAGFF
jgi:hypothetical protein